MIGVIVWFGESSQRFVNFTVLPRKGEVVVIDDFSWEVTGVTHDIDNGRIVLSVR